MLGASACARVVEARTTTSPRCSSMAAASPERQLARALESRRPRQRRCVEEGERGGDARAAVDASLAHRLQTFEGLSGARSYLRPILVLWSLSAPLGLTHLLLRELLEAGIVNETREFRISPKRWVLPLNVQLLDRPGNHCTFRAIDDRFWQIRNHRCFALWRNYVFSNIVQLGTPDAEF